MTGRKNHRRWWMAAPSLAFLLFVSLCGTAQGQIYSAATFDLSGPVLLDECDSATRGHLERARAYLEDRQWDEAVEVLRQVLESDTGRLIRLADKQYVPVRDYCHLQIAALYPRQEEALKLYRDRVDSLARQ